MGIKRRRVVNNKIAVAFIVFLIAAVSGAIIYNDYNKNYGVRAKRLYSQALGGETLSLEEYIPGVVMAVVPSDYDTETIRAMSVVIRTYLTQQLYECDEHLLNVDELNIMSISTQSLKNSLGEDIYNDTMKKYEEAAEYTKGETITYKGKIIVPLYHMVSSCSTRDAGELFCEDVPYLKSVSCKDDVRSREYLKIVDIKKDEFERQAGANAHVSKLDSAGYVLAVESDNGSISGEDFAAMFDINSSCFSLEYLDDDKVRIVSKGVGHGMGLSVYGANELAKQGKNYKEILEYFYAGTKIE